MSLYHQLGSSVSLDMVFFSSFSVDILIYCLIPLIVSQSMFCFDVNVILFVVAGLHRTITT